MEKVEQRITDILSSLDAQAIELYQRIPSGKRVRAKLITKIAGESDHSLTWAAVIELVHAASLLHDDVIDEANSRRGVPSINATFGNKLAIMLGDILYSRAFNETSSSLPDYTEILSGAVVALSEGELMDVSMAKSFCHDEDKYKLMIYKKTAILIEAACRGAARIAGFDEEALGVYGKNLGLAFQIVDDILDITSDEQTLGKPVMNDFSEGKTTLPYIYLYQSLENKNDLLNYHGKNLSSRDTKHLKSLFAGSNAIDRTFEEINALNNESKKVLDRSPLPFHLQNELIAIIDSLATRKF